MVSVIQVQFSPLWWILGRIKPPLWMSGYVLETLTLHPYVITYSIYYISKITITMDNWSFENAWISGKLHACSFILSSRSQYQQNTKITHQLTRIQYCKHHRTNLILSFLITPLPNATCSIMYKSRSSIFSCANLTASLITFTHYTTV